jgi:phosphoribosylanthranilate isomerase
MTSVKICGLRDSKALDAAIASGADFGGFVFYPPSPRFVEAAKVRELISHAQGTIKSVGVFIDPDDALLTKTLEIVPLDFLQLHGLETPERVQAVRARFGLPVIKALRIGTADDLAPLTDYEDVSDWLLLDAKAEGSGLPGGTGQSFDWSLLQRCRFRKPWMLSGGLTTQSVNGAISLLHPDGVDVSSALEDAPGIKNPEKIKSFIRAVESND